MRVFDLEPLLLPLSEASPAGTNLEYDPEFLELERRSAPIAERVIGDSVKEAREPEWDKVSAQALALLERSRDLRVAVHLTCAWTRTEGLAGWVAGLDLLFGLLSQFWDDVHPRLDSEDDDDPTARANAMSALADVAGALGYFRAVPVISSPRLGSFSLRDLRLANGSLVLDGNTPRAMTEIEACCLDCGEEALAEVCHLASLANDRATAIDDVLNEYLGVAAPELAPLRDDMKELHSFLSAQLARQRPVEEVADMATEQDVASSPTQAPRVGGRIESPQDVTRALEQICAYYARTEPSSPIPLLLRRAQRLVGLNFFDLLKDLAPGGIDQLQMVSGELDSDD